MAVKTFYFNEEKLFILNQKLLPHKVEYIVCKSHNDVAEAIKNMTIRGAPAIGCVAAYGFYLGSIEKKIDSEQKLKKHLIAVENHLVSSRPTAVNLSWAIERMKKTLERVCGLGVAEIRKALLKEADRIYREDIETNKKIGDHGATLLRKKSSILTHCNAGALATAGYGTALGVIRSAFRQGKIRKIFVNETRPYLQGARLTAWELAQEKIPHFLITDNMAGYFMANGAIDAVIVGADRIALNGDTANKIGTYSLAVLARYHKIPFYVAAPTSTIDFSKKSGREIPIEERSSQEVIYINGKLIAPSKTTALYPAFDITPAGLISAIITQKGVFRPPYSLEG